jgi:hypothetical protein
MLIVLRVLSAWIKSLDPDPEDVTQLRLLAPDLPLESPADELACEVARKLIKEKALRCKIGATHERTSR